MGNPLLVFHFSIRLRRRSGGNVGISPFSGEISKGLVERGESLPLAFHAFHSPGISTAPQGEDSVGYGGGLQHGRAYRAPASLFFLLLFSR